MGLPLQPYLTDLILELAFLFAHFPLNGIGTVIDIDIGIGIDIGIDIGIVIDIGIGIGIGIGIDIGIEIGIGLSFGAKKMFPMQQGEI